MKKIQITEPLFWSVPDLLRIGLFNSREQIMEAVQNGKAPRPAKAGNRFIWKREEVLDWFENNKIVIYRKERPKS